VTSSLDVGYYTVAGQGTISEEQGAAVTEESAGTDDEIHDSPAQSQWSINTESSAGSNQSTPPGSPFGQAVEFATPPTGNSVDSEGVPMRFRTIDNLNDTTDEIHGFEYSGLCYFAVEEPRSVEQVLADHCWRDAMLNEMNSIQVNKTWELSTLPSDHKAIGLKWVFKVKKDVDGNITKYKARLVAKRYAQREGVDFDEVFAPVARIETVRLLIALAAQHGWQVHRMDIKSAFLNGDLREEVYVQQPPGFVVKGSSGKVLKLKRHRMDFDRPQEPGMQS
jgi:hypothetical protein